MKAVLKGVRMSSKKVNLIADLVRNKSVKDALDILRFTPKSAAPVLYKVVKSAASNAEKNFNQDIKILYVKEIIVNQGQSFKRFLPVSKGRAHPILKRTCHITVHVGTKMGTAPKADVKAEKAKPEIKKAVIKKPKAPAKAKKSDNSSAS